MSSNSLSCKRITRAMLGPMMLAVLAGAAGCATSNALTLGQRAERAEDHDLAVVHYTRVLRTSPDNREAQLGLDRAKLRASEAHFLRGRRLRASNRHEEAVMELQLAMELSPTSTTIEQELRDARAAARTKLAAPAQGQTPLEAMLARGRELTPAGSDLPDIKLADSITTGPQATSGQVYRMLARLGKLSIVFDPQFRDTPAAVALANMTLRQALDAVASATQTFYMVTGPQTITVIPDTPLKRREYVDEELRVHYVSNLDPKETLDLLRIVADVRSVAVVATNGFAIRDTPERQKAIAKLLAALDKARPEVSINVEILEVDRTRMREFGLQFASPSGTPIGVDGAIAAAGDRQTFDSLRLLSRADILVTGLPALYYRLMKTDTSTRTLASPNLRTIDGSPAQAKFGEKIPVPQVQFAPIAQGGVNQQAITSFIYENIGVNIDITPRTHANNEVTLALKVVLSSVSGTGFGGVPTIGNREITTTIRLRDGETNILAGLIRDTERTVLDGIPGLSDVPVIGRLFARSRRERQETDIVLTMTPHIIRTLDLTEEDLRPLSIKRDGAGGMILESMPIPPAPPRDGEPIIKTGDLPSLPVILGLPAGTLPGVPVPPPPKIIKKQSIKK